MLAVWSEVNVGNYLTATINPPQTLCLCSFCQTTEYKSETLTTPMQKGSFIRKAGEVPTLAKAETFYR